MYNPDAPVTKDEFMRIHNISDPATLARLIAEHPNNNAGDGVPADPDYDLPTGVSSWSEWCR